MTEKDRIEKEVQDLLYELSVIIPQEMRCAIEMGDLRENTEFSSALARQHFVIVRLEQLNKRLRLYQSLDLNTISKTTVGIGSIVKTRHLESNKILYFRIGITTSDTNNPVEDKIIDVTVGSPIGKALLNKKEKDIVVVQLPLGKSTFKILKLKTIHHIK